MKLDIFAKWFETLVKNKMGGAALPIAGISLGYLMIEGSRAVPHPYDTDVAKLGLRLMYASVVIFVIAMAGFAWLWLREVAKRRTR